MKAELATPSLNKSSPKASNMQPNPPQVGDILNAAADHTPGPWEIEAKAARGNWLKAGLGGEYVAMACRMEAGEAVEDANARLIAAAPDLLKAVRDWLAYLDADEAGDGKEEDRLLSALREAARLSRTGPTQ